MEEWALLGRLMDAAQRRARPEVARLSQAILDQAEDQIIRSVARAFLEGVRVSMQAHAISLGMPNSVLSSLSPDLIRRLRIAARAQSNATLEIVQKIDDTYTRDMIERYATAVIREGVWSGQDKGGEEVADLAQAQFKTWVRSWPRVKERDHHNTLEGITIPIDDRFTLPGGRNEGAQVLGPRDWDAVPDPGEHMNCGHALRYSMSVTGENLSKTRELGRVVYEPPGAGSVRAARSAPQAEPRQVPFNPLGQDDAQEVFREHYENDRLREAVGGESYDRLRSYTGLEYREVNAGLRSGDLDGNIQNYVNQLDDAFASDIARIPESVTTYRGGRLPDGLDLPDDLGKLVGTIIDDPAYQSTSLASDKAAGYATSGVLFEIQVPKGTRAIYVEQFSMVPDELELLLDRKVQYRVLAAETREVPSRPGYPSNGRTYTHLVVRAEEP